MATFHFDLVSPEKLAFSGEVDQVDVPGVEGDFGVLAGHAPVVAAVRPGILTITTGGTHQKIIVLGGLAEMSEKGLTVLADVATSTQELDRAQFAETISEMEAKLAEKEGSELDRRDRAARPLQEHPARAQRDGDALGPASRHHQKSDSSALMFRSRSKAGNPARSFNMKSASAASGQRTWLRPQGPRSSNAVFMPKLRAGMTSLSRRSPT